MPSSPQLALKRLAHATEGVISGLASAHVRDREGDLILPGAFDESVAAFEAGELVVPLMIDHQASIGSVTELRVVQEGLWCSCQLALGLPIANSVFELAKAGSVPFSIGFTFSPEDVKVIPGVGRDIAKIALLEVTVCSVGMNQAAGTREVKNLEQLRDAFPTRASFEQAIRAGYLPAMSANCAKRFAAVAYSEVLRDDRNAGTPNFDPAELDALRQALGGLEQSFKL